jgi:hypothetical protein
MEYHQLSSSQRKKMRSEEIRKRFADLESRREHGVRKYTREWVLQTLARQYWLSAITIEHIVFYRNGYE